MCNKTEVAVGLSISLTGRFRPQGQQALQGIRLWQSYINAQGGIAVRNGEKRSVRLIWYGDHSQISFARKNVFQLLREDKIDILLGPYSSSLTMAIVEIADEYKKVGVRRQDSLVHEPGLFLQNRRELVINGSAELTCFFRFVVSSTTLVYMGGTPFLGRKLKGTSRANATCTLTGWNATNGRLFSFKVNCSRAVQAAADSVLTRSSQK